MQGSGVAAMDIELIIDELTMYGIDPAERHRVADGLQQELTRLFTVPESASALTNNVDVPNLRLSPMTLPAGAGGVAVGTQVAGALFAGLPR